MAAETVYPARKTEDARRVDEELILVLRQMLDRTEPITVRAVARNMRSINQPSTLTRDEWRAAQIDATKEMHIRMLAENPSSLGETAVVAAGLPEFRSFKYFAAVARAGNVGRAAHELRISQPSLTKQVSALERRLATPLLIRHSRGVTLTRAGSRFLSALDTVMNLLAASVSEKPASTIDSSRLRLAIPPEVAELVVPPIVNSFRERWPHIALDITEGNVEEALLNHCVDIALLQGPPFIPGLKTIPIIEEKIGLVSSPAAALTEDDLRSINLHRLAKIPLILPSRRSYIRRCLERVCFQHNVQLTPMFEIASIPSTKALVRRWRSSALLPYAAVQDEVSQGFLIFSPIDTPPLPYVYAIAFHESVSTPAIMEAAENLCDAVVSLVESGAWPGARTIGTRRSRTNQQTLRAPVKRKEDATASRCEPIEVTEPAEVPRGR